MADKIPAWLGRLVLADFDTTRGYNNGEPPKNRRFFCIVCQDCDDDLDHHKGHRNSVLKAVKSTSQYGIPINVLSKFLDVSEVDIGSINSSYIYFLQKRKHMHGSDQPEASTSKSCGRRCHRCPWRLHSKGARFCSIECKYKPALSESPPPSSMVTNCMIRVRQRLCRLMAQLDSAQLLSPAPIGLV